MPCRGDDEALERELPAPVHLRVRGWACSGLASDSSRRASNLARGENQAAPDGVDPLFGRSISHYRILVEKIGAGGMGVLVDKAEDAPLSSGCGGEVFVL